MTTVTCRSCYAVHQVDATAGATNVMCYLCGERMNLPPSKGETAIGPDTTIVNEKPQPVAPPPSRPQKVQAKMRCTECGSRLNVRAVVGKSIQCPLCTGWFRFVPETSTVRA